MPVPEAPDPRRRLLLAVMGHVAAHGTRDLTLRGLAAALGTSHRMLSYHFGSREGLLEAVAREVEDRQRARLAELAAAPDLPPVQAMWRLWEELADASMHDQERLFFDLYVRGLHAPDRAGAFLEHVVVLWLEPSRVLFERLGFGAGEAEAEARLALAVARGLLLDLLATGDRPATDAAMRRYLARYADRPDAARAVADA